MWEKIGDTLKEMESQFLKEFDYENEVQNLKLASKNMHIFRSDVEVPAPFEQYCFVSNF